MKRLVLIHTVNWYNKAVIQPFAEPWQNRNKDVEIFNIMDDSLLADSLVNGGPTKFVTRRMINYYLAAESMNADVVMCTCTTMGPCTRAARPMIKIPIFNIDEPMAREAVSLGKIMGILATFPTSALATKALLEIEAIEQHKDIKIKIVVNEEAARFLLKGEMERHNEIIYSELQKIQKEVDVIVLGQVSLSLIKYNTRIPMLQVGNSGFNHVRNLLDSVIA